MNKETMFKVSIKMCLDGIITIGSLILTLFKVLFTLDYTITTKYFQISMFCKFFNYLILFNLILFNVEIETGHSYIYCISATFTRYLQKK